MARCVGELVATQHNQLEYGAKKVLFASRQLYIHICY